VKNDRGRVYPGGADHAIIPVMLGDAVVAQLCPRAAKEGIYVTGFFYPVVPKGQARIRTQMSAAHTLNKLNVRWKPLPASVNNWASLPEGVR
jgi:7-keto-8-aminopelargonate synthetase-like enzyme